MTKKLLALLLAICLMAGGFILIPLAADGDDDGLVLIFEENFEEYEKDVNAQSTLMPNFFVCDANSIGDGVINVQETTSGNLYLWSHVFSQVYSQTPIVGAYELSLDILEIQGAAQSGVLIRAPKTASAYYEGDGHPNTSVCLAGLFLYPHSTSLGVNVKTYDASASSTSYLQNNTVNFSLPQGTAYPYNLRVNDTDGVITIYVNNTLICSVTYSDPGQVYGNHPSEGKFYGSAKLFDAQGNEKGSYTNPLLSSDASYIGWTTRAANMSVDNVAVKVEVAYQTMLTINELPTKVTDKNIEDAKEIVAAARELYEALPEDKKALVINYQKLTKAEDAIAELEAIPEETTEEPTVEVTEEVTEEVTDEISAEVTDEVTNEVTEELTQEITDEVTDEITDEPTQEITAEPTEAITDEPTNAPTDEVTDPTAEDSTKAPADDIDEDEPEVEIVDDSLIICILIAIMIVAVCGAAGYITVKVRK